METATIACVSCGTHEPVDYEELCESERCQSRGGFKYEAPGYLERIAYEEKEIRKWSPIKTIDTAYFDMAVQKDKLRKAEEPLTDWSDRRLRVMVDRLWMSLSGDVDRDDIWGLFVDELDMPDLRVHEYQVTVTIVVDVEAADEDEAQEKAIEEIENNTYSYLRDADFDYYEV